MTAFSPESEAILAHLLIQLSVILVACRVVGWLARRLGHSQAIGEILAGLALGPSVFGALAPDLFAGLFLAPGPPILAFFSHLGLILALFLMGMEFDFTQVPRYGSRIATVVVGSLVVPLLAGWALAGPMWAVIPGGGSFEAYALFLGLMMAITAIPIMGRVLMDTGLTTSRVGVLGITTGASKDLFTWILMLLSVGFAQPPLDPWRLVATFVQVVALGGFALTIGRSLLMRLIAWTGRPADGRVGGTTIVVALVWCFLLATATSEIGVFAIFGAFVGGVAISFDRELARALSASLHDLTMYLFLPIFFTSTGLRTDLTQLGALWSWVLLLTAVGSLASGGTAAWLGARAGMTRHEALAFGVLINTPGLMVLILLNVGLDAGIITKSLFGVMMACAMLRNLLVTPVLNWAKRKGLPEMVSASP